MPARVALPRTVWEALGLTARVSVPLGAMSRSPGAVEEVDERQEGGERENLGLCRA